MATVDEKSCLGFLSQYSFIYNFQITKIFIEKPWTKIPKSWLLFLSQLSYRELGDLPFAHSGCEEFLHNCPADLKDFIKTANRLSIPRDHSIESDANNQPKFTLTIEEKKGMNPKKSHEVENLTSLVYTICERFNCQHIVDVGSGLGYLGQILSKRCGFNVYGLESEQCKTHSADQWKKKKDLVSCSMKTLTFHMEDEEECYDRFEKMIISIKSETDESRTELDRSVGKQTVSSQFKINMVGDNQSECMDDSKDNVCMTGLHCCGDLTPTMLRFFVKCKQVSTLVCLGCCYHNMSEDRENKCFTLCPLSQKYKSELQTTDAGVFNVFAFRLAAQETRMRWKLQSSDDHDYHQKNVAFRGLLELFCMQENINLVKEKRKVAHKTDFVSLDTYVCAILKQFSFDRPASYVHRRMQELYTEYEENIHLIEVLTCLQVILQPVLESMIVHDRVCYLQENKCKTQIVPVFDENISPRNLSIIAWK